MAPVVLIPMAIMAVAAMAQAGMAASAANRQAQDQVNEAQRQAAEVNRVSSEQKGDRARQADAEIGTLRALSDGSAGLGTLGRQVVEQQYIAGTDMSRIEGNRRGNIEALRSGANVAVSSAKATTTSSFIGAGLQIAGSAASAYGQSVKMDTAEQLAQNKVQ